MVTQMIYGLALIMLSMVGIGCIEAIIGGAVTMGPVIVIGISAIAMFVVLDYFVDEEEEES